MREPIDRMPLIADGGRAPRWRAEPLLAGVRRAGRHLSISPGEPLTPAALAVLDRPGGFVSSMKTAVLLSVNYTRIALGKANDVLSIETE